MSPKNTFSQFVFFSLCVLLVLGVDCYCSTKNTKKKYANDPKIIIKYRKSSAIISSIFCFFAFHSILWIGRFFFLCFFSVQIFSYGSLINKQSKLRVRESEWACVGTRSFNSIVCIRAFDCACVLFL